MWFSTAMMMKTYSQVIINTWVTKQPAISSFFSGSAQTVNWIIYNIWWEINPWTLIWLNEIQWYNPLTNTWFKAIWNWVRAEHATALYWTDIYVISWWVYPTPVTLVEKFSPLSNTWVTKTPIPVWSRNWSASVVNWKIYYMWWYNGWYLINNYEYDINNDTWLLKANMPRWREYHSTVVYNNQIYVIWWYAWADNFLEIDRYTPSTDTWENNIITIPQPPLPWSYRWIILWNKIYIFNLVSGWSKIYIYDLINNSWEIVEWSSNIRGGYNIATYNNKIYLMWWVWWWVEINLNEEYTP